MRRISLVPEDLKTAFDILSQATDIQGRGSRSPKNVKDKYGGKGKQGDEGNPRGRKRPAPGGQTGNANKKHKKCHVAARDAIKKVHHHTRREAQCKNDVEIRHETVITSISWIANPGTLLIERECSIRHKHACYHYSSALRSNADWSTLSCPPIAATTSKERLNGPAVRAWSAQHDGKGWQDHYKANQPLLLCQRDEYPPVYLIEDTHSAYTDGGKDTGGGQLIRWIPGLDNGGAAKEFAHICFNPQCEALKEGDFARLLKAAGASTVEDIAQSKGVNGGQTKEYRTKFVATMDERPEFSWSKWGQAAKPPVSDGLKENPCWPDHLAPDDPGFQLLTADPFYQGNKPPYDYREKVNAAPMPKIQGAIIPRTASAVTLPRTTLVKRTASAVPVTSMPEVTRMPNCSPYEGDGGDDVES